MCFNRYEAVVKLSDTVVCFACLSLISQLVKVATREALCSMLLI